MAKQLRIRKCDKILRKRSNKNKLFSINHLHIFTKTIIRPGLVIMINNHLDIVLMNIRQLSLRLRRKLVFISFIYHSFYIVFSILIG